jgi:hypothetical protein
MREHISQIEPDFPVVRIPLQWFDIGITPAADDVFSKGESHIALT